MRMSSGFSKRLKRPSTRTTLSLQTGFVSETVYKHSGRNLKWATLGFVVGLAFTILTFTISVVLGAFGFLIMLGSAVYFERNLRRVGRASLQDLSTRQFKQGGFKSMGKKLRGDDQ